MKRNEQEHCRCTVMERAHSFLTGSFACVYAEERGDVISDSLPLEWADPLAAKHQDSAISVSFPSPFPHLGLSL